MFVESFNSKGIKKLAFIYSENFHVCFLWLSSLPFQSKSRIKHKCSTFEALRQCRECERDFFIINKIDIAYTRNIEFNFVANNLKCDAAHENFIHHSRDSFRRNIFAASICVFIQLSARDRR